jgi:bacteriocin-like protein
MSKSETTTMNTGTAGDPAELTDKELAVVTGGETVHHSEFRIVKLLDAATPKMAPNGHVKVFSGVDPF